MAQASDYIKRLAEQGRMRDRSVSAIPVITEENLRRRERVLEVEKIKAEEIRAQQPSYAQARKLYNQEPVESILNDPREHTAFKLRSSIPNIDQTKLNEDLDGIFGGKNGFTKLLLGKGIEEERIGKDLGFFEEMGARGLLGFFTGELLRSTPETEAKLYEVLLNTGITPQEALKKAKARVAGEPENLTPDELVAVRNWEKWDTAFKALDAGFLALDVLGGVAALARPVVKSLAREGVKEFILSTSKVTNRNDLRKMVAKKFPSLTGSQELEKMLDIVEQYPKKFSLLNARKEFQRTGSFQDLANTISPTKVTGITEAQRIVYENGIPIVKRIGGTAEEAQSVRREILKGLKGEMEGSRLSNSDILQSEIKAGAIPYGSTADTMIEVASLGTKKGLGVGAQVTPLLKLAEDTARKMKVKITDLIRLSDGTFAYAPSRAVGKDLTPSLLQIRKEVRKDVAVQEGRIKRRFAERQAQIEKKLIKETERIAEEQKIARETAEREVAERAERVAQAEKVIKEKPEKIKIQRETYTKAITKLREEAIIAKAEIKDKAFLVEKQIKVAKETARTIQKSIKEKIAQLKKIVRRKQIPKEDVTNQERKKFHDDLRTQYKEAGKSEILPEFYKADEELSNIWEEMGISKAGRRIATPSKIGGGYDYHAEPSTFPKWIPEDLRSTELFNKVIDNLTLEKLEYPTSKIATAQRELYNEILSELDVRLGVDTSITRNNILKSYERTQKEAPATIIRKSIEGGERGEENILIKEGEQEIEKIKERLGIAISALKKIESGKMSAVERIKTTQAIERKLKEDLAKLREADIGVRASLKTFEKEAQKIIKEEGGIVSRERETAEAVKKIEKEAVEGVEKEVEKVAKVARATPEARAGARKGEGEKIPPRPKPIGEETVSAKSMREELTDLGEGKTAKSAVMERIKREREEILARTKLRPEDFPDEYKVLNNEQDLGRAFDLVRKDVDEALEIFFRNDPDELAKHGLGTRHGIAVTIRNMGIKLSDEMAIDFYNTLARSERRAGRDIQILSQFDLKDPRTYFRQIKKAFAKKAKTIGVDIDKEVRKLEELMARGDVEEINKFINEELCVKI